MSGTTQNLDETNERLPPTRGTALYLIAIEDIVRSPLIQSQVFSLVIEMASRSPSQDFAIVALYPIANWIKYRSRVGELREQLRQHHVQLHVLPILFLTRYFYIPRFLLPIFIIQAWLAAIWIIFRLRPKLVHCRSYPATIVGRLVHRLAGSPFLFDTRALYPEEGATLVEGGKTMLLDTKDVKKWKEIEHSLLDKSTWATTVSQPMARILADQYPASKQRIVVVPTHTRTTAMTELIRWRREFQAQFATHDSIVVAYAASWFEQEPMLTLLRKLLSACPDFNWYLLLLVSGSTEINLKRQLLLQRALALPDKCIVKAVPQSQVAWHLAGADLALQPVGVNEKALVSALYTLTAQTRLSVKFTEYLAAGLPVLVSRWAGAAADLVTTHDLGLVYDTATPTELDNWLGHWKMERKEYRQRTWEYAREHFALDVIARRYLDLYDACESGRRRP